jgi:hypothetical protein
MPFPGGTYLSQLTGAVKSELDQFYALLEGWLRIEHNEDGSHGDVTAVSVQSGDTLAESHLGDLSALDTVLEGASITSGLHLGGDTGWVIGLRPAGTPGTNTDYEVRLWDLNNLTADISALRLFYYTANSWWTIGVESGGALALGEDVAGKRLAEVNALVVRANTGLYERGRSAAVGDWTDIPWALGAAFTASGAMTWTVASADQITYAYALVGKTMHVMVTLQLTTTAGVADTTLKVAVPGGGTIAKQFTSTGAAIADAGTSAVHEAILVTGVVGGSTIDLYRMGAATWPNSVNQCSVWFCVTFEVQ